MSDFTIQVLIYVVCAIQVLGVMAGILNVGKPRQPTTSTYAMFLTIFAAAIVALLLTAALRLP